MTEILKAWVGPLANARVCAAVVAGGGEVLAEISGANAIVWVGYESTTPQDIRALLTDSIKWVQLDSAGVDDWIDVVDSDRVWTSAKGAYADDVAEQAVAFVLAAARQLTASARRDSWGSPEGRRLRGATVTIVGGHGAIGSAVARLLEPFGVRVVLVGRTPQENSPYASVRAADLLDSLSSTDYLVICAPLTPQTRGLIGVDALSALPNDAWVINVGRGAIVDTKALVGALDAGTIGGACLDVTDPEPLDDQHPLWGRDNVLITPHVANPWSQHFEPLAQIVQQNVSRFVSGQDLVGQISCQRGY
ncbi:NAD(P)-dependent oxidoreductase [Rhodococcus qingshengii]|uniref:NAD(P)-dependent oxidoreductase n=1 Tax=Rhodococcus qingshengii TaxID=334542 RepID=UPI0036DDAF1E